MEGAASPRSELNRRLCLGIKDVPVDGFWSVSVYNADGYFQKNPYDAYTLNQHHGEEKRRRLGRDPVRRLRRQDAQLSADRARLELSVHLYRPRAQILNGVWTFPQAYPVN